jgi:hypothetical protein
VAFTIIYLGTTIKEKGAVMVPFKFYWNRFDIAAGIKYLIGTIIILFVLPNWLEFPWIVVGFSSLLAWVVVLLGKPGDKILLISSYLVVGLAITWLSNILTETYWPWLAAMFVVAFIGTYLLKYGMEWYMLGWSLIYWFMLMPMFKTISDPQGLLNSHIIGSVVVLVFVILEVVWNRYFKKVPEEETAEVEAVEPQETEPMAEWWINTYSTVVGLVMVIGLILGHKYLKDATMISNAAFMIIVFTGSSIIWKAGLERLLAAILAIVIGFYLGVLAPSEALNIAIIISCSFFLLACIVVNNGLVVFFLLVLMGYGWGLKDFATGNALGNERIIAELAGIILAASAITAMNLISKYFKPAEE